MSLRRADVENGRAELPKSVAAEFLKALQGLRFDVVADCERTRSDAVALLDMVVK